MVRGRGVVGAAEGVTKGGTHLTFGVTKLVVIRNTDDKNDK